MPKKLPKAKRPLLLQKKEMTTITISDNIFKNTDVVLDYLRSPAAFDEPSEAVDARWISIAISGEENEAVFRDFATGKTT